MMKLVKLGMYLKKNQTKKVKRDKEHADYEQLIFRRNIEDIINTVISKNGHVFAQKSNKKS